MGHVIGSIIEYFKKHDHATVKEMQDYIEKIHETRPIYSAVVSSVKRLVISGYPLDYDHHGNITKTGEVKE